MCGEFDYEFTGYVDSSAYRDCGVFLYVDCCELAADFVCGDCGSFGCVGYGQGGQETEE